jgi:hypothetical protein
MLSQKAIATGTAPFKNHQEFLVLSEKMLMKV